MQDTPTLQGTRLNTRQIHSLTDFLRNHKAHIADLKETRTPKVLTVNGRAEVVVLDAESYQELVEKIEHEEEIRIIRAIIRQADRDTPQEALTSEELDRRARVMAELTAETERLGLYR